ncbi:hypothetical protein FJ941_23390 [Mesorhizobium sp. B2-3-13]|uniref:hypothetical protein n=1 Tax=Mesorhizobium sp. B2-3-13 TaxID=2589951 RepID=UPI00112D8461|nr:hypothetical protein [Mesorhizobium sp. B2-3-13]TPL78463.1 hypothetical protein FJ941_23390 [Mesorhizobium sp. B2-3-13]
MDTRDSWSLREQRREIDGMFDYRYSQLLDVFTRLILAGHMGEALIYGLSRDKLETIRSYLAHAAKR